MELNEIMSYVLMLVTVGMLIGVGIVTMEAFAGSTFYAVSNFNDTTVTFTTNNTLSALSFGNITSIGSVLNGTKNDVISTTCYQVNSTAGQISYRNTSASCSFITSISVVYSFNQYATASRTGINAAGAAVSSIATSWLGLLTTIVVLSILIVIVVRSFGFGGSFGGSRK